jgi:hypothetical protein
MATVDEPVLVCYVPYAWPWADRAETGGGDHYFLQELCSQNADIIASHPALRDIFRDLLNTRCYGYSYSVTQVERIMQRLFTEVAGLAIGVIIDEAHAMEKAIGSTSRPPMYKGASYFKQFWYNWPDRSKKFVRLDIGSCQGAREITLPPQHQHRLRFLHPWSDADVEAALSHPASHWRVTAGTPAQVRAARGVLQKHIGGVARLLARGIQTYEERLKTDRNLKAYDITKFLKDWDGGLTLCLAHDYWVKTEPNKAAYIDTAFRLFDLLYGHMGWHEAAVKGAYDNGLVTIY